MNNIPNKKKISKIITTVTIRENKMFKMKNN